MANEQNVLGKPLKLCCHNGGYTREGFCHVPASDYGSHSVCAVMTDAFLHFSLSRGNDLISARPEYSFPGLKAGDKWCLCAARWLEAERAGVAPPVILEACNKACLNVVDIEMLRQYAV
ncbi:DUF2237 family protein [Aestuariibacter salexigens]|uniref:DUF2237 family protein n=1 Tax=Aestuariibacter salexigens TaxID=226010 RepID=UPI000406ABDA|nr:DUF2237 domain-containing protein [Aestuariibacter salexigens]